MNKGAHGREDSVGSIVTGCKARCALAVEDTSKFVELHNILQKIPVCFGILSLVNNRRNMDGVVVPSLNDSVSMTRFHTPFSGAASMENTCQF